MPEFSQVSKSRLAECHPELQRLFNEVVKHYDCTILCGYRSEVEQKRLLLLGNTKVAHGKHNCTPAMAVDAAPWFGEVRWNDTTGWYMFVGYVLGTAEQLGIKIRCGADWNGNHDTKDQTFNDLPHFELVG